MTNSILLDIRTMILERHAQHVVLIHFPIALFMSGVAFDLLSRGKRDSQLARAAYINLSVAALTVLPAIVTGLLAWQLAFGGTRLDGIMLFHLLAASFAALLVVASWWIHWRTRRSELALFRYRIPVELLGIILITVAAHTGGFVSGVNQ
ncbi:MAG: hypothetical protein JOZ33_14775 [Acidobacteriaceae bacterium]|nr:hypothetical protein [Acidobacteriaceae bacterium]